MRLPIRKAPILRGRETRRLEIGIRVDPDVLRPALPVGSAPRLRDGSGWISVSFSKVEDVRARFLPIRWGGGAECVTIRVAITGASDIPRRRAGSTEGGRTGIDVSRDRAVGEGGRSAASASSVPVAASPLPSPLPSPSPSSAPAAAPAPVSSGDTSIAAVWVPRYESDSLVDAWLVVPRPPASRARSRFDVVEEAGGFELLVRSLTDDSVFRVATEAHGSFPAGSSFASASEAVRFFDPDGVAGARWLAVPQHVHRWSSTWLRDRVPEDAMAVDHAVLLHDVSDRWHAAPDLHGGRLRC